jgi:hypothetical protein
MGKKAWSWASIAWTKATLLLVGPAIRSLEQGAQVIDLPGMIEIMADHDADDGLRGQALSPVRESLAIQFGILGKRADRGKPAVMSLRQPGEKLTVRA